MGRGYYARIPQQELDLILRHTNLAAPSWPTFASRSEGRLFLNRIVETGVTLDPRGIARLNDRMPFIIYIDIRHKQNMKTVREK